MTNSPVTRPSKVVATGDGLWRAWPSASTDLATSTVFITQLTIRNPTAGTLTFTIADKAGSPLTVYNAHSLAAGAEYTIRTPDGMRFSGGMTTSASGAGLVYSMTAWTNS